MSHGKTLYLAGSVSVKIDGREQGFKSEASLAKIKSHAQNAEVSGPEKEIVDDLNFQISKEWKKKKCEGDAPEVTKDDVDWNYRTGK
jgi:hypothetical protein